MLLEILLEVEPITLPDARQDKRDAFGVESSYDCTATPAPAMTSKALIQVFCATAIMLSLTAWVVGVPDWALEM
jgi:hypothetical protein